MEYEILYFNDNGTAKVRMTIDGKTLEEDFACDDLDTNVKQGMAVFKVSLSHTDNIVVDDSVIGKVYKVLAKDLPIIPPEDFEPESPVEDSPVEEI